MSSRPVSSIDLEGLSKHAAQRPVKNKHRIEILGRKYTLRSDSDESYARALASIVDGQMRKLAAHTQGADVAKLAIVTAINMAHEICLLKKQQEEASAALNQKTGALIEQIEAHLAV